MLLSNESISAVQNNPQLLAQLQTMDLADSEGRNIGKVFDENGKVNKFASLANYQADITKSAPALFKNSANKISEFSDVFVKNILKTYYRGDLLKKPEESPTHLITQNGIFPLSDNYFDEIVKSATVSVRPSVMIAAKDNINQRTDNQSEITRRFATMIEAKEEIDINSLFIPKDQINPLQVAMDYVMNNMDFDINVSLIPGFNTNDLNTIQYNYVRINGKTIKIPVEKTDTLKSFVNENNTFFVNYLLNEALTNNFVLSSLVSSNLLTHEEATSLRQPNLLTEDNTELKTIFRSVADRSIVFPELLMAVLNRREKELSEEKKRNYAMEYRNYHGKPKQRKERAKRTKAREQMIKKGKVKKGDGKDIDHKKALRHGGSNGINNLRVRNKSENRADNGHSKGENQDKDWK